MGAVTSHFVIRILLGATTKFCYRDMPPRHPLLFARDDAPAQKKSGESDATLAVSALVIALAVLSSGLRFYTRIFTKAGLKADDWMILAAVISTLATAALLLAGWYHISILPTLQACMPH
jgi:hypothetical protein